MKNWKNNVHFVLVEPKESGNIGACARAIKNMDFNNLCLVNPPAVIGNEAQWFAHNSEDILESAAKFDSFQDALDNKHYVVGTSRRRGRKRGAYIPVEEGTRRIREAAESNKVAILFGREDRGLYNEEIEECAFLMTIPASKKHPSLNIAQAVMIISYELSKAGINSGETGKQGPGSSLHIASPPKTVSQKELSLLYKRMEKALELLNYISSDSDYHYKKVMRNLKHCLGRAGLTNWEYNMFHGICQQIERKCRKNK
jgi:TrmH family RNA methyltransferase